jgi:hypothetical protein
MLALAGRWLAPAPPAPGELMILSLELDGYRSDPARPLGRLGDGFLAARFDDQVRLEARLSEPAYGYLIAFNTDGQGQLCHPSESDRPPSQAASLSFPADPGRGFRLNDGPGLQAFVLVASRVPLPTYDTWKGRIGAVPWHRSADAGSWRYDGRAYHPLGGERGAVEDLPGLGAFTALCQFLRRCPGVDAIQALAFPVRTPEEGQTPTPEPEEPDR